MRKFNRDIEDILEANLIYRGKTGIKRWQWYLLYAMVWITGLGAFTLYVAKYLVMEFIDRLRA